MDLIYSGLSDAEAASVVNFTQDVAIPEPVTAALGLMGLAGLTVATRRRRMA